LYLCTIQTHTGPFLLKISYLLLLDNKGRPPKNAYATVQATLNLLSYTHTDSQNSTQLENIGSRVDMQTDTRRQRPQVARKWRTGVRNTGHGHCQQCDRVGFRYRVTLTFDLLTARPIHAEQLLYSIHVPSLVSIAQTVFLLERGQTD